MSTNNKPQQRVWQATMGSLLIAMLAGCQDPYQIYRRVNLAAIGTEMELSDQDPATLQVYTAVSRDEATGGFGAGRAASMTWAVTAVNIPKWHYKGLVLGGIPFVSGSDVQWNDVTLKVDAYEEKKENELIEAIHKDKTDAPIVIFVHGYNTGHDAAIVRGGQIAFDLSGPVTPVVYSWPCNGKTEKYATDENNVGFAADHLSDVLEKLLLYSGDGDDRPISILAHSMGCRVTLQALLILLSRDVEPADADKLQNLVLAAADVDAGAFATDATVSLLQKFASRTTVYVNPNDHVLKASEKFHAMTLIKGGLKRLGQGGCDVARIPAGVDVIDVSLSDGSLVGHSYYGSNLMVLHDLEKLLIHNLPSDQRGLLTAEETACDDEAVKRSIFVLRR